MYRTNSLKTISKIIFVALILITATALLWAGNEAKGKYYFKSNCKECHTKAAVGGEITPMSKTQAQWKAYFMTAKHHKRSEPLSKMMPDEQLLDVQTFLVNHAVDSLQPETCGK